MESAKNEQRHIDAVNLAAAYVTIRCSTQPKLQCIVIIDSTNIWREYYDEIQYIAATKYQMHSS